MNIRKTSIDSNYKNLITFVPQKTKINVIEKKKKKKSITLDGDHVKVFYESLLNEECTPSTLITQTKTNNTVSSSSINHCSTRAKHKTKTFNLEQKTPTLKQRHDAEKNRNETDANTNKMLCCAQRGNSQELRYLLESGLDINVTDLFGWTPLMCAAYSGHSDCVRICLEFGANRKLVNQSGQTAEYLAVAAGNPYISTEIANFMLCGHKQDEPAKESKPSELEPFWCSICKMYFSSKERLSHDSSMVHLFNTGHKPAPPNYLIPPNNPGFQMMLRKGWMVDSGLGLRGDGNKYPIKTVLKHDREGLGVNSTLKNKRITHFSSYDVKAVSTNMRNQRQVSARISAKRSRKTKEYRSKRWERNIRDELN